LTDQHPELIDLVRVGQPCDRCYGDDECEQCGGTGELSFLVTLDGFRVMAGVDLSAEPSLLRSL
jgi:hypothetical protein